MTAVCRVLLSDEDDETPEKCRERRRRRIEMRRLSVSVQGITPATATVTRTARKDNPSIALASSNDSEGKRIKMMNTRELSTAKSTTSSSSADDVESPNVVVHTGVSVELPVYGTMSVSGRLREMEDAVSVRTNLCRSELNRGLPVHFFGVFDGHGGPHVAALCKEKMHMLLEEELMRVQYNDKSSGGLEWKESWRRVMSISFERMDEVAINTCACGSVGFLCGCHPMGIAFAGSTAVVAVLTQQHIVVANCGDSKAVLCRGRRAIPLTLDHKPDRPDELARIGAAGGRVIYVNGARVEGILAMSRAIGDKYLKPVVISEPEITYTKREEEDECLILASDGLWDVLSIDLACEVARECLQEENHPVGAATEAQKEERAENDKKLYPSRSVLAAALLTRLALARRSSDNISVIVIDLKSRKG